MSTIIIPCRQKWAGTMSDRERFNRQMHYQPVDRCFNMEFGYWDENFKTWDVFVRHGITNNSDADRFFNFDRIEQVRGITGLHPLFEQIVVRETATTRIIRSGGGLLAEVPKDQHDTIPHFLESSIKTPDDWKQVKAERFSMDHPARKVDVAALQRAHPANRDYPLGVWTGSMIGHVRNLLTFEGLCYAIYDYPEMVEDMVETHCRLIEQFLDQVLGNVEFDYACGWEDICFKNGPIVPVPFFCDVVLPRYVRIRQRLHRHGITLWYTDCDGDVRPILPYLLEGGINCLFPFEVNGCAHPAELLQEYGRDLRIMGGVDKMSLGAGKEAIRKYLESLTPLVERGGYIPFCDHRCPPNVSPADYLYYLDLKESMSGIPGRI